MFLTRWLAKAVGKTQLRLILIVPFVLQILVILGITGFLSYRSSIQAVDDLATELVNAITARIELHVQNYLAIPQIYHQLNQTVIDSDRLELSNAEVMSQYFWRQVQLSDAVSSIYFGDVEGNFVGVQQRTTGETVMWRRDVNQDPLRQTLLLDENGQPSELLGTQAYDPRQRPWYQAALEQGTQTWSPIYRFASNEYAVLGITLALPVFDANDELLGVMAIDLPLEQLSEFLRALTISEGGRAVIIERTGEVVASSTNEPPFVATEEGDQRLMAINSREPLIQAIARELSLSSVQASMDQVVTIDGQRHFIHRQNLSETLGLDWEIVVVVPEADFIASINANTQRTLFTVALASIIAAIIGLLTYRWIVEPITRLNAAAASLAQGDLTQRVDVVRQDELGDLATSFNRMAGQLQGTVDRLAEQNRELQRLDRLKDEFLTNTSHELRTPLNGIIGIASSMIDGAGGPLTTPQQKNLDLIISSGQRLSNLIDDILDLAKLRNDMLRLDCKPIRLQAIVDVVMTLLSPLTSKKSLRLINSVDVYHPPIWGDSERIQQILVNLIENAIKFTDKGKIEVSAEARDGFLKVKVVDTGVGIPQDFLERIFHPFEQVDGTLVRSYGGTGIGLSVARQLVDLHGGEINVHSTLGVGSEFIFTLPIANPQQLQDANFDLSIEDTPAIAFDESVSDLFTSDKRTTDSYHILVVDDEHINRQVLINQLAIHNYRVTAVASGAEALDLLDQGALDFDVIILDVMMPRTSGYEICRRIRNTYGPTELPIILLTAKAQPKDVVAGFEAGANDYLIKPFSQAELIARIKTHLQLSDLRELNARKDQFFSIMAHDLKKPFQPLLGFSQYLGENADDLGPTDIERISQHIYRAAKSSYNLLDNLLQWSLMQRGRIPFVPVDIDLLWLADRVIQLLSVNAAHKDITLVNDIEGSLHVHADRDMIDTVIRNLLFNAIKYTDNGGRVTIEACPADEPNFVRISVNDTGIGISSENMQKLFKLEHTQSTPGTDDERGTGLGLVICQEMVTQHQGRIWVDSKLGKGSTFHFTLPAMIANEAGRLEKE